MKIGEAEIAVPSTRMKPGWPGVRCRVRDGAWFQGWFPAKVM